MRWWRLRQANVAVVIFALLAGYISAHAEMASIYGDGDGLCGHPTASGERFDCSGAPFASIWDAGQRLPRWMRDGADQ